MPLFTLTQLASFVARVSAPRLTLLPSRTSYRPRERCLKVKSPSRLLLVLPFLGMLTSLRARASPLRHETSVPVRDPSMQVPFLKLWQLRLDILCFFGMGNAAARWQDATHLALSGGHAMRTSSSCACDEVEHMTNKPVMTVTIGAFISIRLRVFHLQAAQIIAGAGSPRPPAASPHFRMGTSA